MNGYSKKFDITNFRSMAGLVFLIVVIAIVAQFALTWSFAGHVQL